MSVISNIISVSGEISTTMAETERINVLRTCWYATMSDNAEQSVYHLHIVDQPVVLCL